MRRFTFMIGLTIALTCSIASAQTETKFTNDVFGVSLSYPKDWKRVEPAAHQRAGGTFQTLVTLAPTSDAQLRIAVSARARDAALDGDGPINEANETFLLNFAADRRRSLKRYETIGTKETIVAGLAAVRVDESFLGPDDAELQSRNIVLANDNAIVVLTLTSRSDAFNASRAQLTTLMNALRLSKPRRAAEATAAGKRSGSSATTRSSRTVGGKSVKTFEAAAHHFRFSYPSRWMPQKEMREGEILSATIPFQRGGSGHLYARIGEMPPPGQAGSPLEVYIEAEERDRREKPKRKNSKTERIELDGRPAATWYTDVTPDQADHLPYRMYHVLTCEFGHAIMVYFTVPNGSDIPGEATLETIVKTWKWIE